MSEKKYPTTLVGVYKTKGGGQLRSAKISADRLNTMLAALENAGSECKLVVRPVSDKTKAAKGDKFPDAFIEIMTDAELDAERAAAEARQAAQTAGDAL